MPAMFFSPQYWKKCFITVRFSTKVFLPIVFSTWSIYLCPQYISSSKPVRVICFWATFCKSSFFRSISHFRAAIHSGPFFLPGGKNFVSTISPQMLTLANQAFPRSFLKVGIVEKLHKSAPTKSPASTNAPTSQSIGYLANRSWVKL